MQKKADMLLLYKTIFIVFPFVPTTVRLPLKIHYLDQPDNDLTESGRYREITSEDGQVAIGRRSANFGLLRQN